MDDVLNERKAAVSENATDAATVNHIFAHMSAYMEGQQAA